MMHLTLRLFVLAVTLSCGLAYVATSSMKCECTCSPINNPSSKYFAVGNFEASLKPKTEMKTTSTTDAVTRLENKIPAVPPELKESPFKEVDSNPPKRERYNYMNNDKKEPSVNIIKKRTTVPIVNTYSSKPAVYSSYRSTTYGFVSPTSATILPNAPIQLKITPPSAARTAVRQVSKNTTELKDETLNEIIDTKRIDEISKTKALTLDDIIFGKVPFDFGTRGIQRIALTDSEIKALKDQPDGQKSSTMNASKMTKMSTTGATPSETAAATEFIASETTASKMAALGQKSTMTSVQPETSFQPETPTTTMETATTTVTTTEATATTTMTTTVAPPTLPTTLKTVKPNSRRGLLPLFRTAFSPLTAEKTEKPNVVTFAAGPSTESSTIPTVKTTPASTTKKVTVAPTTTPKRTTKTPTTTTTTTTSKPTTVTTQKPIKRQQSTARQQSYNVNPSTSPPQNTQKKAVSVISKNQANPSYRFSDSFRKNTIRNLLDAFKPEYMKTLHEDRQIATPVSRPRQPQQARQQFVQPPPPQNPPPQRKAQMTADIPFGHFEKTRTVDVPNHHLVHSMSSLSSMTGQQSANSHHPSLVVLDSPAQQVSYHLHGQDASQQASWNPIQEPKKWGESKLWPQQNGQLQQQQRQPQQQQQQHQSMLLPNQQAWNSQAQQNSLQKTQVYNPSFAMAGQTQQQQQQQQRLNPFPGLQLNKSPIDFRVH